MKMKNIVTLGTYRLFLLLLCVPGVVHAGQQVAITYDPDNPMHVFGVRDLRQSVEKTGNQVVEGNADFGITIAQFAPGMRPQSFRIQREGTRGVRIIAGDSVGAMHGALELAEQISLGGGLDAVQDMARKPCLTSTRP